jgi:hypothetical protein
VFVIGENFVDCVSPATALMLHVAEISTFG